MSTDTYSSSFGSADGSRVQWSPKNLDSFSFFFILFNKFTKRKRMKFKPGLG